MAEQKYFSRSVRCTLTTDDKLKIGSELAQSSAKLESLEEELKEIKDEYKSKTSAEEAIVGRCQRALNSGWQMRSVECYWVMDEPKQNQKSIVRTDTGEIVDTEAMSANDRQQSLPLE